MRHTFCLISVLLLATASTCKNGGPDLRLHDIWALQTMRRQDLPESAKGKPYLEIHVNDKKMMGNGGCNEMFGAITFGDRNAIQFSNIGSTKMACPELSVEAEFLQLLSKVQRYELRETSLFFFGANDEELLKLKKVD